MAIATTTPWQIREDFLSTIRAIVPTHPQFQDQTWRYVKSIGEVPGPTLRLFTLEQGPAIRDGILNGDGESREYDLFVWTSYGALNEEDDESIISEDARQLFQALLARQEGPSSLPGLLFVEETGWEDAPSVDEHGHRWGSFGFKVHYFAPA